MDAQALRRAGGGGGGETDSSTHVAGALSCVVGNFLISLSLNLQRRAHRDNTEGLHYTKLKAWWVAILCMFVGEIGNFLAYGMAPASLVSPLGAITVISNAVLSKVILDEPMPRQKAAGVVLALVGAVLIAVNAPAPIPPDTGDKVIQEEEVFYYSIMTLRACIYIIIVAVVAFCVANPLKLPFLVSAKLREDMVIIPCVLCGCAGTMTVSSAKAVFNSLSQAFAGKPAMFARLDICWLTYLTIVVAVASIVGQVKYLNEALMRHGASRVVPVYYITFTTITMSAGMTLFLELKFEPFALSIALFVVGLLCAFSGVWLINSLPEEEGEAGSKSVGAVRDGGEGVGAVQDGGEGAFEGSWDDKPTILEADGNDVEMALAAASTATTTTPDKTAAWAEDTGVVKECFLPFPPSLPMTLTPKEGQAAGTEREGEERGGEAGVTCKPEFKRPPSLPGGVRVEGVGREEGMVFEDGGGREGGGEDGTGLKRVPSSG